LNVTAGRTNDPAVPTEIERKFLVSNDAWRVAADHGRRLRQAYIAETDHAVIRVRTEDDARGVLTIKSAGSGLSRAEYEYSLPLRDARELFQLRQGSVVEKMRFTVPHAGRVWEVDVYSGDNEGLVIAEVELESEADLVEQPDWAGHEVTGDPRYYAARLARSPFRHWPGPSADKGA
jgi:adenylate cyclase